MQILIPPHDYASVVNELEGNRIKKPSMSVG